MLRAFLDLVMMCMLEQHAMSAYEISGVLMRDFGVRVGSSTIYSKLYTLEKQGQISCVMGRSGKVYSLTKQGQQTMSAMPMTIEEICNSAQILLTSQNSAYKKKKTVDTMTLRERHNLLKLLQQENEFPPSHTYKSSRTNRENCKD